MEAAPVGRSRASGAPLDAAHKDPGHGLARGCSIALAASKWREDCSDLGRVGGGGGRAEEAGAHRRKRRCPGPYLLSYPNMSQIRTTWMKKRQEKSRAEEKCPRKHRPGFYIPLGGMEAPSGVQEAPGVPFHLFLCIGMLSRPHGHQKLP
uniref:Uncharacterized protein n=1 Tax=Macaca nemestrina TaxID=9545 RepID=A0A2K6AW56_MACNE